MARRRSSVLDSWTLPDLGWQGWAIVLGIVVLLVSVAGYYYLPADGTLEIELAAVGLVVTLVGVFGKQATAKLQRF